MYCCYMKKFEDFLMFLVCNNWHTLLKKVEEEFLMPENITKLYQKIIKKNKAKITRYLLRRKDEF